MTERTSRLGLKALALATALVAWFFASVEKRERISEKVVDAAVTYNLPRGTILLDPIQSVKVRLRGPDRHLRNLSPFGVDVVVDVSGSSAGRIDVVHLSERNVARAKELEVLSLDPGTVTVRLDVEATRTLPVVPRIVGEPAAGAVPGAAVVQPHLAVVRGPQSLLGSLDAVTTSPVTLDGHAFSFDQTVSVIPPDPLVRVLQPGAVTVRVPLHVPENEPSAAPRERGARSGGS